MRALIALLLMTGMARAETPLATTATYGAWTLGCTTAAQVKTCQLVTRLNVKGQDGQVRPLLALGLAPLDQGFALRAELPSGTDLRARPDLGAAPKGEVAGQALATFDWLTCEGAICLAELSASDELLAHLVAAPAVEVGFTLWQGGRKLRVPVSLEGFGDAFKALKTN